MARCALLVGRSGFFRSVTAQKRLICNIYNFDYGGLVKIPAYADIAYAATSRAGNAKALFSCQRLSSSAIAWISAPAGKQHYVAPDRAGDTY
jgi:hypothetical protein